MRLGRFEERAARRRGRRRRRRRAPRREETHGAEGAELFERLRALRRLIAERLGVPPYVVFSDATLRDMALLQPAQRRTSCCWSRASASTSGSATARPSWRCSPARTRRRRPRRSSDDAPRARGRGGRVSLPAIRRWHVCSRRRLRRRADARPVCPLPRPQPLRRPAAAPTPHRYLPEAIAAHLAVIAACRARLRAAANAPPRRGCTAPWPRRAPSRPRCWSASTSSTSRSCAGWAST